MSIFKSCSVCIALCVFAVGCVQPTDSEIIPDGELITHVTVTLIDSANTLDTVRATFVDEDGAIGSKQPTITGATLLSGRTYLGSIQLEDRSKTPVENINEEIEELNAEHQFFYTLRGQAPDAVTVQIIDRDQNDLPLGLAFMLRTKPVIEVISDTLNVVLSHYQQTGQKNGSTRSDDSDIDINFPLTITP